MKSAAAQGEKIIAVDEHASKLMGAGHYASEEIGTRRDTSSTLKILKRVDQAFTVLKRHEVLKQLMETKRTALLESWIADKSKIAADEPHEDSRNLEGKLE